MDNTSISFTSKIRFVDRPVYKMMKKANYIDFHHNSSNIMKAKEFYSEEIRTCTGGGLVSPSIEAEGFHFLDDKVNNKKFPMIVNSLFRFVKNPERGLLIGSKELKGNPYSIIQFENLKKTFLERVKNVSLFQKHRYTNSESYYHYSLDDDTWTILSAFRREDSPKYNVVKSLRDLRECFEKISIADGDRLFIGKKEILPEDCPEIFNL